MLQLGASKPWPDALEVLTGQREMDATALTEYFAPLQQWLKKQNAGQKCGW
jgi:peptidyl-dipeptidase A